MISSRMALTGLLFIDLTSHTLEEKWTAVAYLHVYKPLVWLITFFQAINLKGRAKKTPSVGLLNLKNTSCQYHKRKTSQNVLFLHFY